MVQFLNYGLVLVSVLILQQMKTKNLKKQGVGQKLREIKKERFHQLLFDLLFIITDSFKAI